MPSPTHALELIPPQPAQPDAQRDVEKGSSPSQQVYGTFLTKSRSDFENEKGQGEQRRLLDNVWWALGVSLMVVSVITIYAIVIVSAAL